ncbi:MAG: hypothetical protein HZB13_14220, partial [Acidobacteria bacterium]|nr:hypothetical protein [Acidobacteriota bacterium]
TDGLSIATLYGSHSKPAPGQANCDEQAERRPRPRPQTVAFVAPPPPPPAPVPDQIITIRGIDKKVETLTNKRPAEDTGRNQ